MAESELAHQCLTDITPGLLWNYADRGNYIGLQRLAIERHKAYDGSTANRIHILQGNNFKRKRPR